MFCLFSLLPHPQVSNKTSYALVSLVPQPQRILTSVTPVTNKKAIKNDIEIEGMRRAHVSLTLINSEEIKCEKEAKWTSTCWRGQCDQGKDDNEHAINLFVVRLSPLVFYYPFCCHMLSLCLRIHLRLSLAHVI